MLRTRLLSSAVTAAVVLAPFPGVAQQATERATASAPARGAKQFTAADLQAWKSIRSGTLSSDGKWLAYVLAPNEGDANVVIRSTADSSRSYGFPIGELPQPGSGPGGGEGQAAGSTLAISGDARWVAFTIYPARAEARRLRQSRRPLQNKVAVVNVATGDKREFEKVRRFAFAGEKPRWIALYGYAPEAPSSGGAAGTAAGGGPAATVAATTGADLLLYDLESSTVISIGNVGEFGFDESGSYLAYTIDARDHIGNGVQIRDMRADVVKALDSEQALYRRLAWMDSGAAFAVLRGKPDTVAKDTTFAVLAFTGIGSSAQKKTVFDPAARSDFPAGMKVAADRTPRVAEDLSAVFIGIREARKASPNGARTAGRDSAASGRSGVVQPGAPGAGGTINQPRVGPDDENSSLIIWHARDPRLQSQQIVQEQNDRNYTYLSEYRIADNKFVRLSDDSLRSVTVPPRATHAFGTDIRDYEQPASYSGRRFADFYTIDLKTGTRKLALKKAATPFSVPSPDGRQLLYWGDDGHYYVLDLATGERRNITKDAPVSFVNVEDDHNNLFPPAITPFSANVGWAKDNANVLLTDRWDIWKVPVRGGPAVNLTGDGRATQTRYQRRYSFDPKEKGIDLSKPLYFSMYGEWTKKEGLARVEPGKPGAKVLLSGDTRLSVLKARDADVFVYTRQTATEFPNYRVTDATFRSDRQLTDANPQRAEFAWSSGTRLIDYTSDKGDKLQGALYLPANHEPGKKYPLLVTIYERRSQNAHQFVTPNETSTPNRSVYTSRGYAVLDPDIVYKVNDPGMSAVWSVLPAVKAALATGIVDSARVGLWGHSWGGYQTAFLVTQTNMFKAAVAGAPLTDLVSMYSSVYWNTGGTNQAIFESSQGRFKGNFIDNYDAYIRNSPAFHAQKVTTPLIILHNDKDGAVDFNQGITYYNTLRQLGKDVILLEYVGENHGLQRPVNQKDYAERMAEWFDHYLKGMPAPDWMVNGVPRLKMEDHLKERKDAEKNKIAVVP